MGQLSDPYDQGEDAGLDLTISGLPDDLGEPGAGLEDEVEDDIEGDDGLDVGDQLDDDEEGDDEGDAEAGGEAEDEVAYSLDDFDDDQLDALFDGLDDSGIAYLWDGDELFVQTSDEQAVDELLDRIANPHELAAEDGDGDGGGWLLGELFVVADRLQHDPEEHESVAMLLQLADAAEEADPPYGLAEPEWVHLQDKVTALAAVLEQDKPDPDEAIEAARELRSVVRPYV